MRLFCDISTLLQLSLSRQHLVQSYINDTLQNYQQGYLHESEYLTRHQFHMSKLIQYFNTVNFLTHHFWIRFCQKRMFLSLSSFSFQFTEGASPRGPQHRAGDASHAAPELELGIPAAASFLLSGTTKHVAGQTLGTTDTR